MDGSRLILGGVFVVLIGVLGYALVVSRQTPIEVESDEWRPRTTGAAPTRGHEGVRERVPKANPERRPELSARRPAEEPAAPVPREQQRAEKMPRDAGAQHSAASSAPPAGDQRPATSGGAPGADYSRGKIDSALAELGIDAAKRADLEGRFNQLAADELQLRQEAARDGWIDSPEFAEDLDSIEADRQAIRNEIGDEAYDHFLFATGQTNRVYVTGVEQHSPADVAGLQTGDVIIRFEGARVFGAVDLLAEIGALPPGKAVQLEITRQGKPLQLELAGGALGIVFDATQEPPALLK